jgi:hypothetical protein
LGISTKTVQKYYYVDEREGFTNADSKKITIKNNVNPNVLPLCVGF